RELALFSWFWFSSPFEFGWSALTRRCYESEAGVAADMSWPCFPGFGSQARSNLVGARSREAATKKEGVAADMSPL
ncbi:MAG: hypothetical protein ACREE6_10930, partial [Limisphaerales bacterium]